MSRKKSKKKSPVTFRLPDELEEDWQACLDTGAEQTEIVIEALKRELPALREIFRRQRLEKLGIKTIQEGPKTQAGAQTLVSVKKPRANSAQKTG